MARVLRKRTRVCYYEPEEPSFDEYIYCTSCGDYVYEYCSIHGPLLVIPDDKVPTPTGFPPLVPRAALTIPKVFLHLAASHIPGADIGVFCTLTLPAGVRFGPYLGARTQHADGSAYCWQIYDREDKPAYMVDARDGDKSNWMRYVNCSRHSGEQNLVAFQYQGQIYYRTIKIVPHFSELLVFYGSEFALELDIDLGRYHAPRPRAPLGLHINAQNRISGNENPMTILTNKERTKSDNVEENILLSYQGQENILRKPDEYDDDDIACKKIKLVESNTEQDTRHLYCNGSKHVTDNKSYICDDCGKTFKEKASLICHISTHNVIKKTVEINAISNRILKFPCVSCDSKFATKSEVINHSIKVHDSKMKYKACDYCDYKTVANNQLKRHMRTHSGTKPHQCTECDSKFTQSSKLKSHLRTHTGEKPYQCTVCDSKFSNNSSLKTHLRIHTGEKPYQCTVCDSKFYTNSALKRHLRTHTGEKPYQCTVCDSKFSNNDSLKTHLRIHTDEKPYQCTECDLKYNESGALKRHLRTHTGEKPYQCTECDSKFTQSSKLKSHLRTHTGEKPYQCTVCDSKFSNNSSLKTHLRIHTGEKPYQCTVCDSKFSNNSSLKTHLRIHTGEKPYQCTVCDSKFSNNSSLKTHLRIHTGEKPYQCTVCDSKFYTNSALKRHLRTHTGEKPYQCTECDLKYNESGALKRHLRTHTGEKPYQCTV